MSPSTRPPRCSCRNSWKVSKAALEGGRVGVVTVVQQVSALWSEPDLETMSRWAEAFQPSLDPVEGEAQDQGGGRGGQGIADIMPAGERQPDLPALSLSAEPKNEPGRVEADFFGPDFGPGIQPEDDFLTTAAGG